MVQTVRTAGLLREPVVQHQSDKLEMAAVMFFGRQDNSFPAVIRMLPPDTGQRADRYFRRQQST